MKKRLTFRLSAKLYIVKVFVGFKSSVYIFLEQSILFNTNLDFLINRHFYE